MKDTLLQTKNKYNEWVQNSENTGEQDLWSLISIINKSEHSDTFKNIAYNKVADKSIFITKEDFWLNGIFDIPKEILLNIFREQMENALPFFEKIIHDAITNMLFSSEFPLEKIKNLESKIVFDEQNRGMIFFMEKK